MKINYVTTDIEFDSNEDLSPIVNEFGDRVSVHLNQWVDDLYRVALGLTCKESGCNINPFADVEDYCKLLESLSAEAISLWKNCSRRVVDIAFESGTEPNSKTYELPEDLVRQMANLGLSVAITVYRTGAYSDEIDEVIT